MYLTSQVTKIKQFKKLEEPYKKIQLLSFPYFLENGLSQLILASYGGYYLYLWFSPFLCFVLSPVDRLRKNEDSQHVTFFLFAVYKNP